MTGPVLPWNEGPGMVFAAALTNRNARSWDASACEVRMVVPCVSVESSTRVKVKLCCLFDVSTGECHGVRARKNVGARVLGIMASLPE